MEDIRNFEPQQLAGLSFQCACGRPHQVGIRNICIGKGISGEVVRFATDYGKQIFLISDAEPYNLLGKSVEQELTDGGFKVKKYVFSAQGRLIPDEAALGRLLIELDISTDLIIAVGSGTINDLSRMLSYKTCIPYFIVCTAPSMDGYASMVSPLIVEHFKSTFGAVYPDVILADTDVMKNAPAEMIEAGFGDIIGKYNALTDWMLSKELNGEYYCKTCVQLVNNAIFKCVSNIDGIVKRDEKAIEYLFGALVLSGVAIGMVGNSRPASGAEHHMAHYWEIDALKNGREHPLHGNSVGVATAVMASVYEFMQDKLPPACKPPKPYDITLLLRKIGACDNPKELGISRSLFKESLLHAKEIRPRYTILQYACDTGRLDEIAQTLTHRYYD
jgi:glycerol-1-phosphate dehydrogenase [NAD(P)+]